MIVTVHSAEGQLEKIISGVELTAFRTALVTSCVLRHSLHRDSRLHGGSHVVIFGSGNLAKYHTRLSLKIVKVNSVTLVNRGESRLQGLTWLKDLQHQCSDMQFSILA
ncbi:hypothetical protein K461DRAFT_33054 [Myriangium duriaei CBS 260.36]|uniref:Uncharacterized protein n=1 Tax=Myriangium duriaei CBS 260.36 TaxID=1168546 RepID=A0A9P4IZJ8_9PEZI|nr:hypothetical protein K461DRAFT_33054 [Myriangium duriaei CBS 260.36]